MRVLYLEDSPSDVDLTRQALRTSAPDIHLHVVGSVAGALALLDDFQAAMSRGESARFDLALLDLNLPDGSGLNVLAEVRHRALPLAVVVLTGKGDEQTVLGALRAGADDYLAKRHDYWTALAPTLRAALTRFRSQSARRARPLRLLYAEPNEHDVALTYRHLATYAPLVRLEVVGTADEVLSRLPLSGAIADVDVVLLDYRMPGMDALEALKETPAEISAAMQACRKPAPALATELMHALADELPAFKRDGGFIRAGFDASLDETRALRDESRRVVAALQARYADETGVRGLKIRHNNVLGYFVEVTAQHGDKLMAANQTFIHRQTLAGQVRFTSTELGELAAKIASAAERSLGLELELFERLAANVMAESAAIKQCAEALASLDVASALAALADERDYARPQIDDSLSFVIEGGRHPVVEQALARDGTPFVANDSDLSPPGDTNAGRIWLITGPNMAGKSTFLRQNALIAIMAQTGSFVPAKSAHIGVVDRLFSRVGAADDLARGRSTIMVEMVETAAILNQAGARSLVILDEIGRGTATFDGLSIAWATVEHLHDVNKCRALFATHFHELTALAARLDRLHNATVRVKEWAGDVVFLHEVVPGSADHSYGIQVAKLAGLPASVIERARLVLAKLEQEDRAKPKGFEDLPLFAAPYAPPQKVQDDAYELMVAAVAALNPDDMSPREAMEALYMLKAKLDQAAKK